MDLKITQKTEEPLLSRIRIQADVTFDSATPAKKDIQAKVASLQKVNENLIVVKNINTRFGEKTAKTTCFQYEDEKKLKIIEPKVKEKKDKKPEEKEKEEPKKEEKKEEKKEPKPEPKKEEKPKEEAKK